MINALVFSAVAIVMIVALYIFIHHYFPTWGTVVSNAIAGVAVAFQGLMSFIGVADSLPWGTVLSAENSAKVLFALAMANILMRLNGPKLPVGTPNIEVPK